MKLLLDTCTFLWIVGQPQQLPAVILELYASPDNEVYRSAASAWEIASQCGGVGQGSRLRYMILPTLRCHNLRL